MKVIIVSHGKFSIELLKSAKMIYGDVPNTKAIAFTVEDSLESLRTKIENEIEEGEKTLILTDIKGGSPFNVSYLLLTTKPNIELMYGVNLPLVLSITTMMASGLENFDTIFKEYQELIGKTEEE